MTNQPSEPPTIDQTYEEIVSYLDGELDAETTKRIEHQLTGNPRYGRMVQELDQAWDCLDQLPRTQVDESFTDTTIEMVSVMAAAEVEGAEQDAERWKWYAWLGGAAAVVVAALAGDALVSWLVPRPNEALLRDLQVIERVDLYLQVDSIGFLHNLHDEGIFHDEIEGAATLVAQVADLEETRISRRLRVETMNPPQKEDLRAKQQRFGGLDPAEQQRLRELHHQIALDPESERVHRVMLQYFDWLKLLSAGQVAELSEFKSGDRIPRIKQLRREQQAVHLRRLVKTQLTPEDIRALFSWLDGYVEHNEKAILKILPAETRRWLGQIGNTSQRRRMLLVSLNRRQPGHSFLRLDAAEMESLRGNLSPAANQALDKLRQPRQRMLLLQKWVQAAVAARLSHVDIARYPAPSPEVLAHFFQKGLTAKQRERLEGLPRERFDSELRKLYYQKRRPSNLGRHPPSDRNHLGPIRVRRPRGGGRQLPTRFDPPAGK